METFQDFKYYSFSTRLAVLSFISGTLFFIAFFLLPQHDGIIIAGLFFMIFAAFFNSLALLHLLYQLLADPSRWEQTVIRMLIVLANIPIGILYLYLIVHSF